jgi:D-xylose transport system substrate-binding protein
VVDAQGAVVKAARATAVLAFAALAACKGSAASSSEPRVAFLLSTLQEERYTKDKRFFEEAAKRRGLSPFTLSADNDNARQLAQIEDALAQQAKVLVIQPTDSGAARNYVAKAHEAGAKVVAYDRSIPGADFYVAHDSFEVGVIQAEAAIEATHGKGNYVLLDGQSGHSVATEIARGYHEALKPYVDRGDIKIVVEQNHDAWAPEQALATVEDALSMTKGDVQAILANNSGMARGAVQAVQSAGLGGKGIFIAGADADAANVNYVCEGKQAIEVLKDIKPLAEQAATVAAALIRNGPMPAHTEMDGVSVVAVPVVRITAANARTATIDTGFHTAAALPSCR